MIKEKYKDMMREMVNFTCEECKNHEDLVGKLEAHRIKRGNVGGKYFPRNIKMVCSDCHKAFHAGEFR